LEPIKIGFSPIYRNNQAKARQTPCGGLDSFDRPSPSTARMNCDLLPPHHAVALLGSKQGLDKSAEHGNMNDQIFWFRALYQNFRS